MDLPGQAVAMYNSGDVHTTVYRGSPLPANRFPTAPPVTVAISSNLIPATVRIPLGPIAMRAEDDNPELLINPMYMDGTNDTFQSKQFHYYMDGIYTGELFLNVSGKCQFRSFRTELLSDAHGKWTYCKWIQGIQAHFDYSGDKKSEVQVDFLQGPSRYGLYGERNLCRPACGLEEKHHYRHA